MPKGEIKSRDVDYDFLGLLTETIDGKDNKFNGAIKLDEDSIYIEERSRLNGKVKDAFTIDYDEISQEDIQRLADNKIQFNLSDKTLLLKTLDDDMLNNFESRLINKLTTGSFEVIEETQAKQIVRDIPEEIRKYHELLKDGIITEEEFENKKKELLKI
ncbi:MAG: SHOCT domain-containing protein [Romboutsia sp.]|nr:SHOCT domain-containing protein [Romboutsia sp.]